VIRRILRAGAPLVAVAVALLVSFTVPAAAELADALGAEHTAHWGGFLPAVGPVAEVVTGTYNRIFWIILVIGILVEALILWCLFKFRRSKRGDKVSNFSHNTTLEVLWTVIPVLICVYIGYISYHGLRFMRTMPAEHLAVEVVAHQFYWDFDYPDQGISAPEGERHEQLSSAGQDRTVKHLVVPVNTNVVVNVTAADVLHAFYVPALGVKVDAIPGRINYLWFNADEEGDYIGQCAELCGAAHGEMFFNVRVVSQDAWKAWVNEQRKANGLEPMAFAEAPAAVPAKL
jgi:cytochrome c oxidase subunit 2